MSRFFRTLFNAPGGFILYSLILRTKFPFTRANCTLAFNYNVNKIYVNEKCYADILSLTNVPLLSSYLWTKITCTKLAITMTGYC